MNSIIHGKVLGYTHHGDPCLRRITYLAPGSSHGLATNRYLSWLRKIEKNSDFWEGFYKLGKIHKDYNNTYFIKSDVNILENFFRRQYRQVMLSEWRFDILPNGILKVKFQFL